jgi:ERCC4-related helicase
VPSFSPSLKEAVEDYGVLASTKAIVIKSRTLDENNPNAESRDLDKQMMARLSSDPKRTEMLVKIHANYVDEDTGIVFRDQKAVVHCFDIDHAKEVAEEFNKEFGEGTAAALHSGLSSNEQEALLNQFKRSEIRVLTNVGMAQHLDDPSCTIGYNFVPSRSAALIEKQSQIVMQVPRSTEDIAELNKFQPGRSKQAFVVDFFNEGTQG